MHRETRLSRRGGRPRLLAALAALGAVPAGAGGAVEAPISAVTVDPGGAVVERRWRDEDEFVCADCASW